MKRNILPGHYPATAICEEKGDRYLILWVAGKKNGSATLTWVERGVVDTTAHQLVLDWLVRRPFMELAVQEFGLLEKMPRLETAARSDEGWSVLEKLIKQTQQKALNGYCDSIHLSEEGSSYDPASVVLVSDKVALHPRTLFAVLRGCLLKTESGSAAVNYRSLSLVGLPLNGTYCFPIDDALKHVPSGGLSITTVEREIDFLGYIPSHMLGVNGELKSTSMIVRYSSTFNVFSTRPTTTPNCTECAIFDGHCLHRVPTFLVQLEFPQIMSCRCNYDRNIN